MGRIGIVADEEADALAAIDGIGNVLADQADALLAVDLA
jgi:hypothetical protein